MLTLRTKQNRLKLIIVIVLLILLQFHSLYYFVLWRGRYFITIDIIICKKIRIFEKFSHKVLALGCRVKVFPSGRRRSPLVCRCEITLVVPRASLLSGAQRRCHSYAVVSMAGFAAKNKERKTTIHTTILTVHRLEGTE